MSAPGWHRIRLNADEIRQALVNYVAKEHGLVYGKHELRARSGYEPNSFSATGGEFVADVEYRRKP